MSVDWNVADTAGFQQAMSVKVENLEFEKQPAEYKNFMWLRDSVIHLLLRTQFPPGEWAITEKNHEEIFRRIFMIEAIDGAFRNSMKEGGGTRPHFVTLEEVKSLVGMRVNAGNLGNKAFDKHISDSLRRRANEKLHRATQANGL